MYRSSIINQSNAFADFGIYHKYMCSEIERLFGCIYFFESSPINSSQIVTKFDDDIETIKQYPAVNSITLRSRRISYAVPQLEGQIL